jgi:hypothetical protein
MACPSSLQQNVVDNSSQAVDNAVTLQAATSYLGATDDKAALYAHGGARRIPSLISRVSL